MHDSFLQDQSAHISNIKVALLMPQEILIMLNVINDPGSILIKGCSSLNPIQLNLACLAANLSAIIIPNAPSGPSQPRARIFGSGLEIVIPSQNLCSLGNCRLGFFESSDYFGLDVGLRRNSSANCGSASGFDRA